MTLLNAEECALLEKKKKKGFYFNSYCYCSKIFKNWIICQWLSRMVASLVQISYSQDPGYVRLKIGNPMWWLSYTKFTSGLHFYIYTVFRKKHPLTFSSISPWVMCRFKQKLQWIWLRNGRFWTCRNYYIDGGRWRHYDVTFINVCK